MTTETMKDQLEAIINKANDNTPAPFNLSDNDESDQYSHTDYEVGINALEDMPAIERDLIGWSLAAKVAGRCVSWSMILRNQGNRKATEDQLHTIDEYNDLESFMDELEQSDAFFAGAGKGQKPIDAQAELAKWKAVLQLLMSWNISNAPDIRETFKGVITGASQKRALSAGQLKQMAQQAGLPEDQVKRQWEAQTAVLVNEAIEAVKEAMIIFINTKPDHSTPRVVTPGQQAKSGTLTQMVLAAVESAKSNAIKSSNSVEETMGTLVILNHIMKRYEKRAHVDADEKAPADTVTH